MVDWVSDFGCTENTLTHSKKVIIITVENFLFIHGSA